MSQLILDEQLDAQLLLPAIQRWASVKPLPEVRPGELILDERIPQILLTLQKPTFVTIDHGFWNRRFCHPNYCILCFALPDDQQEQLARMLRDLFKQKGFTTRTARMGKVARIGSNHVHYYEFSAPGTKQFDWPLQIRKRWKA
jgi:hypothetical protein